MCGAAVARGQCPGDELHRQGALLLETARCWVRRYTWVRNQEEQDEVQESVLTVLVYLDRKGLSLVALTEADRAKVTRAVAWRVCRQWGRSRRRVTLLGEAPVIEDREYHGAGLLLDGIERRSIWEYLKLLRPQERLLVEYRVVRGFDFRTIGELLGISEPAARMRWVRLKTRLRCMITVAAAAAAEDRSV